MSEFNGTPHNSAKAGEIAKTVIMPGDPLRAQFIAEHFLENVREVSHVRGMLAYTGTYKGKEISVMGHGMGIPSVGIYTYELYKFYGVENIIRTGTCGGRGEGMDLYDVVLVDRAYSESSFADYAFGYKEDVMYPSEKLVNAMSATAEKAGKRIWKGTVESSDAFYFDEQVAAERPKKYDILAVEMESFGLFANARYLGKNAACILTVSDIAGKETTPEERQTAFNDMIRIALDTAAEL